MRKKVWNLILSFGIHSGFKRRVLRVYDWINWDSWKVFQMQVLDPNAGLLKQCIYTVVINWRLRWTLSSSLCWRYHMNEKRKGKWKWSFLFLGIMYWSCSVRSMCLKCNLGHFWFHFDKQQEMALLIDFTSIIVHISKQNSILS